MPRKHLEYSSHFPYHIYGRSNNAEWFHVGQVNAWKIFCTFLNYVSSCYNFDIHGFVLMSNHYHIMGSTPDKNLALIMNRLLTEISIAINELSGRKNHVFGGQYRATIIKNGKHYRDAFKYIYRNPVQAKMVVSCEDYPYSTLSGLIGNTPLPLILKPNLLFQDFIEDDYVELLNFLNDAFTLERYQMIQMALKRREFRFNKRLERLVAESD